MLDFVGQQPTAIDAKKRIIIPKKFRDGFAGDKKKVLYITRWFISETLQKLAIYPRSNWEKVYSNLYRLSTQSSEAETFYKKLSYDTEKCSYDSQFRLILPQRLIEVTGIGAQVMLAGAGDCLEIWDMAKWLEYQKSIDPSFFRLSNVRFSEMLQKNDGNSSP